MTTSASNAFPRGRAGKREETARRIVVAAQELVLEHGLDGFTMDDLAAATGVSRRTLFNYFPSKLDACLGPPPTIPQADLDVFRAGGPTGVLISDLEVLARQVLHHEEPTQEELVLGRRLLQIPRFHEAAHERFEDLAEQLQEALAERDGHAADPGTARLIIRLLVAVVDSALDASIGGDDTPLPDLFSRYLATARSLLA
ncbi:TetR/AcrR family transcriptional regulator [Nocardioides sp. CPCC 205120]|uniref:TetR/AcrR family transcriptional regulator n=1 Tax=Nocardioides sp. CPCC 205120 TaxID=3406462 RepID=UPI003B5098CA